MGSGTVPSKASQNYFGKIDTLSQILRKLRSDYFFSAFSMSEKFYQKRASPLPSESNGCPFNQITG